METLSTNAAKPSSAAFFAFINHPVTFRLFMLRNLPAAYFSGLRIQSANEERAIISIPYKWFTRNPFRCTYFACLSMAAEMSTGILAMANTYKRSPKISMLVTAIEGKFYKRATGLSSFVCEDGKRFKQTIEAAFASGEVQTIKALSTGFTKEKEMIAEFWITWSFKVKPN